MPGAYNPHALLGDKAAFLPGLADPMPPATQAIGKRRAFQRARGQRLLWGPADTRLAKPLAALRAAVDLAGRREAAPKGSTDLYLRALRAPTAPEG